MTGESDDTKLAFLWSESVVGGLIVAKRQHERWRQQWFLDFELSASTGNRKCETRRAVMRRFRNPGYAASTEAMSRGILKFEASILYYLQDVPVRVPKYYGYNEELGLLLMECVPGDSELIDVLDSDERFNIFCGYLKDLAVLHSQPLDRTRLPESLYIPASTGDLYDKHLADHLVVYNRRPRTQPEPGLEFGLAWVRDHRPQFERPMRLGLGDIGPNQFIFDGGSYASLIDFEFAMVADPLLEIGLMRTREMGYHIGRLGELIEYYGQCYEKLTGEPLDVNVLQYWTIYGAVVWPLLFNAAIQHPNPLLPDQAFLYSFDSYYRRCIPEAMAEHYGIALDLPELPEDGDTILTPLHDLLIAQLEMHYQSTASTADDRVFATSSTAIARTLARGDRFGAVLDRDNLDELTELLGARPVSVTAGLRHLETLVMENYSKDFEKRIRFFHRFELRKEFLYEPMQLATGNRSRVPLTPLVRRDRDQPASRPVAVEAAKLGV